MQTVIRQASISDKIAIWDFIKVAYGDSAQNKIPDRWNWAFLENPLVNKSGKELPIFIAIKDGKIVGQICAILYQIKIGDKMHCMACGVDFIVLPICRGEGVGQKLMQAIVEYYGLYMNTYMAASTRHIYHRLGFSEFEPIPYYRRLVKLNSATVCAYLMQKTTKYLSLNRIISFLCHFGFDKMVALTGNILIMSRNFLLKGAKKGHQTKIIEIVSFGDDIDQLWNITNNKFKVIVKRDQQFLNWRFSKNPNFDYRCFIGKRYGVTKGYIVLRNPAIIELNIGIIVDIYAAPDDHETVEDLIRHAIDFFGESVTVIECPTTQQEHQRALSKLGFLKMEKTVPAFFCKDSELKKELEGLNKGWFLTKSDPDWDQLHQQL